MLLDGILQQRHRHHKEGHHHGGSGGDIPVESRRSGGREIKIVRRVLDANDIMAERNRKLFADHQVFVLNMMSSPGSGKTTTLEKTLKHIMQDYHCGVVVGDICTTNDADRLAASGAPVVQINTDEFGGDCHLAAHVVEKALDGIDLHDIDVLIVENIGNLVCPAEFDIGEDKRTVILSVTEGEDKPLKYPLMFRECDAALLNKTDLLPYLDYDPDLAEANILQIHPGMPVFRVSARTEEGFGPWLAWLKSVIAEKIG
ncbi:MAG: hydrogenase nickel incorporation protein HypB [Desulfobacterales bacterium]